MSEYGDLLELLKQRQEETKLLRLLEEKGCGGIQNEKFGLNQWTNRLIVKRNGIHDETHDQEEIPGHLVCFLSITNSSEEECLNTNAEDLHQWITGYKWKNIPGLNYPFIQGKIQACSEGLILPQWRDSSAKNGLDAFLLIRRDGICEYGMGKDAYYFYEKDTIFQLIHIVGRLWQFLLFINDLHELFLKNKSGGVRIIVNLRGTEDAYLGNLAERWNEPIPYRSFDTFCPKCIEKHVQIQKKISPGITEDGISEIVRWFATRIDNAWGQFEPRCYVSKKIDEATPFAFLPRK